ncbi:MAG: response regulator [Bdellovibrionia bacterium]
MKSAKAYSILIVDDEVELCEAVATAFEMKGHKVTKAPSGQQAIEFVKKSKFDLVLSDIRMNDGDGLKLLGYIKDMNLNRPVVALMTGYADVTRDEMYEMGAEAVFEKPFKVMELIKQLTKSLDQKDDRWSAKPNVLPVFKIKIEGVQEAEFKLGRGGFAVKSGKQEPTMGQIIEFDLVLRAAPSHVAGQGVVRWVKSGWCGVEFLFLEEPMRGIVLGMIDTVKSRTFIPKA